MTRTTRKKTSAAKAKRKPVGKTVARKKTAQRKKTSVRKAPARKKVATRKTAARKTTAKRRATTPAAKARKTTTRKPAAKRKTTTKTVARKSGARNNPTRKVTKRKVTTSSTPHKKAVIARGSTSRKTTATSPRRTRHVHATIAGIAPYKPAPGEAYMSDGQREHFTQLLRAWKRELMEEVDRTVHHMQDEASNFPDPNDRASQESEFSLELRTRDRERKLLRKIDQTIKELELGDYGWCEACGAEIGIRRLEARPTASLCIDCKTLDELRERQIGR